MTGRDNFLKRSFAIVAAFAALAALAILYLTGQLSSVPEAGRASVAAAVVGFVGVAFTACVTLIGLLLKDSLDRRAGILQREAELRLKAETSLKAIELMTAKGLADSLAIERRQGALIALSSLNYHALTLMLCERYWKEQSLSSDLLMSVIDAALNSDDYHVRSRAADLIEAHATLLPESDTSFLFPPSFQYTWKKGVGFEVKHALLRGLMQAMVSKPYADWNIMALDAFLYTLYKMFSVDEDPFFKLSAALCALRLVQHLEDEHGETSGFFPPDRNRMNFSEVREAALQALGYDDRKTYPGQADLDAKIGPSIDDLIYNLAIKIAGWREAEAEQPSAPAADLAGAGRAASPAAPEPAPPAAPEPAPPGPAPAKPKRRRKKAG